MKHCHKLNSSYSVLPPQSEINLISPGILSDPSVLLSPWRRLWMYARFIIRDINSFQKISQTGAPARNNASHTSVSFIKHPIQVGFMWMGFEGGVTKSWWRILI